MPQASAHHSDVTSGVMLRQSVVGRTDVNVWAACGGVQVNPGDIVGCDDDGVIVVPLGVAVEVAWHAKAVLASDMAARRKHYGSLGMPPDDTVDVGALEAYYAQFERPE